jgi:hypothetical protein
MTIRDVYGDAEFHPHRKDNAGTVSFGLTDGAGRDYYAVNAEMDQAAILEWGNGFMRNEVWPHLPLLPDGSLDMSHPDVKPISVIAAEVERYFTDTTAADTHFYAYYGVQDMDRIHGLYGDNWQTMPKVIPRAPEDDLSVLARRAGDALILPEQTSPKHHALNDARHDRDMHRSIRAVLREQTIDRERALQIVAEAFERSGYGVPVELLDDELHEIADKTIGTVQRDQWYDRFPMAAMGHAVTVVSALREILGMTNTPTLRERFAWDKARAQAGDEAHIADRENYEPVPFVGGPYDGLTLQVEFRTSGPNWGPPYFMPMQYRSPRCISACQYGRKINLTKGQPTWRMELTDKFPVPEDATPYPPATGIEHARV